MFIVTFEQFVKLTERAIVELESIDANLNEVAINRLRKVVKSEYKPSYVNLTPEEYYYLWDLLFPEKDE